MAGKPFDLHKQLQVLCEKSILRREQYRAGVIKNAEDACDVMVLTAREHTPHASDGKRRGVNVISGELEAHWEGQFVAGSPNGKSVGVVTLSNNMQYASFVQNGHKLKKHFVPWLEIDNGVINYEPNHNQPLFGIIVGTKTQYVPGVDMVGPAIDAFNEAFEKMNEDLAEQLLDLGD